MATIVLGISGSIAAYKAPDLASQFIKAGHDVYPILTENASKFIAPITLRALTDHPCPINIFDEVFPGEIAHIHLATIADVIVVAPASMDLIARLAHGFGNDMLTATISATKAPVVLAPGMNTNMWHNPATQRNLSLLSEFGYQFVEPVTGKLACNTVGVGKMAEVPQILIAIDELLNPKTELTGKRVLVTAGPTREFIDPVRYITNRSSGKMGYALAQAALSQGADVTLVTGPVGIHPPVGANVIRVTSAQEMHDACLHDFGRYDIVIAAAAVSDYRPAIATRSKIKKQTQNMPLELMRTPDILAEMGTFKLPWQILIGFAAETDHTEEHALAKLNEKRLDFIVANDITEDGAGFDVDTNIVTIYGHDGYCKALPLLSKRLVADEILDVVKQKISEA